MRVWSRDSKNARWHPSNVAVTEPTAAALQEAIPDAANKVRWFLVEDERYGHLYEFRNRDGHFEALNWPATKVPATK